MAKHVIIFGAGASFGSDKTNTPPLGSNLFSALQQFNPDGWGRIDGELANAFQSDFEGAMTSVNSQALPPLQRAMAAYFFRFQPTQNSLYYKLSLLIAEKDWSGALVTLNYERLLEISLLVAKINPFDRNAHEEKFIELCLPHGGCNLFCESVKGLASAVSFSGLNVQTNGPIIGIRDTIIFQQRIQNDAFPPVMSYFEPSKRTTSGVNFIEGQRKRYEDLVNNAEKVIIVGLRIREHDEHIWKPLSNTKATLIYCSGNSAGEEFKKWAYKNRNGKIDKVLMQYFDESFDQLIKELELN